MSDQVATVIVITRTEYDYLVEHDQIQTNTIYFVKETTSQSPNILSLYLGLDKQCDLWDITKDSDSWDTPIDLVDVANNFNIPPEYQINNKLLFYSEKGYSMNSQSGDPITLLDSYYHLLMWHEQEGDDDPIGSRFLECGIPRTTVICPEGLPGTSTEGARNNNVYIVTEEDNKSIYIFDGTNYIKIFNDNDYLKSGNLLQADHVTILEDTNHVISGVGANVAGKTYTISGTDYTAGTGATIYNDYTSNITVGVYSNVFGQNNTCKSSYSNIFGKGNNDYSTTLSGTNANFLNGVNLVVSGNADQNAVFGYANTLTASNSNCNLVTGSGNHISGTNANYNVIYGSGNSTSLTTIQQSIVGGMSNSVSGQQFSQSVVIGFSNQVTGDANGSYGNIILGSSNTCTLKSNRGCLIVGQGLVFDTEQQTDGRVLLGKYNDPTITDSIFTIGNGSTSAQTSDCVRLSSLGTLQLCGTNGNAVTVNGETIESNRQVLTSIVADASNYTTAYLPQNGQELLLSDTYTVSSITITDITRMFYDNGRGVSNKAVSNAYNSVIMFKKDSSVSSVEDLITNFTTTGNTKIYLLNKDLDISTYDIIHIMLFNDGFHICAIVAGYEE